MNLYLEVMTNLFLKSSVFSSRSLIQNLFLLFCDVSSGQNKEN